MSVKPGPLNGIRVLDVSWVGVGCIATWLLAELGAEVIKVEPVNGSDNLRSLPPDVDGVGVNHLVFDRYKKSLPVDLRTESGREVFLAVAKTSDAVIEGMRTGVADRLGIGAQALQEVNPKLTYVTLPGYGSGGPLSAVAGHDLNFDAVAGILSLTWPGPMGPPPVQAADYFGATLAALAAVSGVLQAGRTGRGAIGESSLFDGAMFAMVIPIARTLMLGEDVRAENHMLIGSLACYSTYECSDGRRLAVAALEPHFWKRFCELAEIDDDGAQFDVKRQDMVRERVSRALKMRSCDEWIERFGDEDVCVSPVLSVSEAVRTPHVRARGGVGSVRHPAGTTLETPASPFRFASDRGTDRAATATVPALGEGAYELLVEAGFSAEAVARLAADGIVVAPIHRPNSVEH